MFCIKRMQREKTEKKIENRKRKTEKEKMFALFVDKLEIKQKLNKRKREKLNC